MPAAAEILRGYANASLQQMARQRGLDVKGKGKESLVGLVAPTLYDPERIRAALADLEPVERLLLDRLVLAGGSAPTHVLRRQLEREGRTDPPRHPPTAWSYSPADKGSPWQRGSRTFTDVVARLGVLGLAFATPGSGGATIVELGAPGRLLIIPPEILGQLPGGSMPVERCDAPPIVRLADPAALLRDVYVFLAFVDQAPVALTARGQIMKRTLVQIDGALVVSEGAARTRSEDDLGRLPFLRAILEERALLLSRPGALALGAGVEEFLSRAPGERSRLLYESYRQTPDWCELFRIGGLAITTRGGGRRSPPSVIAARARVLAELAELPTGEWIPLAHVVERLKRRSFEFLFSRTTPSASYYYSGMDWSNPYGGANPLGWTFRHVESIGDEEDGWNKVEAGFIRVILAEPLHWLGAVDLGFSDDKLVACRITADGAWLLRGQTPDSAPVEPHVVVQPNFQIFAFPPTSEDALFKLDRLAERVRAEQVCEYRLTRESVYRAQRAGLDTAAIVAFLEQVSRTPLPQNVRRTLEEWGDQHERIVVRRGAALLQAGDEAGLDALYADPNIGHLLGRRLGPTVALVSAADLGTLHNRLLDSGQLPALDEGLDESPSPVFAVEADGRIAFGRRLPSIHVLRALRPFADEEPGGALRLTTASLQRAARAGVGADQVLAVLERWHAGPLPAEVPAMVRRWARDWGTAALVEAVLLQVQSPDVLADLLADPTIGPYLRPVPGAGTLAVVRREDAARVRSALDALGIPLSGDLLRYSGSDKD